MIINNILSTTISLDIYQRSIIFDANNPNRFVNSVSKGLHISGHPESACVNS